MRFETKLWHPNVSSQTGAICLDILKDKWTGVREAASEISRSSYFMSLHGAIDEIVPLSHGRGLFESAASGNKILRCFPRGGHNDLIGHPGYFGSLNSFYSKLL